MHYVLSQKMKILEGKVVALGSQGKFYLKIKK